jgi:predicted N-acetyltransferase YhbS
MSVGITRADPSHLDAINAVIEAAKRSLPYDPAYLSAALPLLRVDADYLARCTCFEAASNGRVVGFAAVDRGDDAGPVLDHLWIEPADQGRGIGRRLAEACAQIAREQGAPSLRILADPPSEGFYLRLGAQRVGTKPSRISGGPAFPMLLWETSPRG